MPSRCGWCKKVVKKRLLIIICVASAVTATSFLVRPFFAEPSYEGKYLSDWIWQMETSDPGPKKEHARTVVQKLAPEYLPLLRRWIREQDKPSLIQRYDEARSAFLFWLMRHKIIENKGVTHLQDYHHSHRTMAVWAFEALNPLQKILSFRNWSRCLEIERERQPNRLNLRALRYGLFPKWHRNPSSR